MKFLIYFPFALMLTFVIVLGTAGAIDIYKQEPETELLTVNYKELNHADSLIIILQKDQKIINEFFIDEQKNTLLRK